MNIGLIGYGAIGQEIVQSLTNLGESGSLCGVLVRPEREAPKAVHSLEELLLTQPDVVLECAGHGAVSDYAADILSAGVNLIVSSVGSLADDQMSTKLLQAAHDGSSQLLIPPGAVAGLDGLMAAQLAGLEDVLYTSYKPPHAWNGTQAEQVLDLQHTTDEELFFEGSAREAALAYPKNANVAVAVAFAGLGLDQTRVRLVSSNRVNDPLGVIEATGAFGQFRFEILGLASPSNPKTSALTAYSLLQCARLGTGLPISKILMQDSH